MIHAVYLKGSIYQLKNESHVYVRTYLGRATDEQQTDLCTVMLKMSERAQGPLNLKQFENRLGSLAIYRVQGEGNDNCSSFCTIYTHAENQVLNPVDSKLNDARHIALFSPSKWPILTEKHEKSAVGNLGAWAKKVGISGAVNVGTLGASLSDRLEHPTIGVS